MYIFYKKAKLHIVIASVLALLLLIFLILYHNSYSIALSLSGFRGYVAVIDSGINSNGDEYRIVLGHRSGYHEGQLRNSAYLAKSLAGM